METIVESLKKHVKVLATDIGSRSIQEPLMLGRARDYILHCFESMGMTVRQQHYTAFGESAVNIVAHSPRADLSSPLVLVGAHYDTVMGTPGADDNASAVAVMLETAQLLSSDPAYESSPVLFAAFSTEEPPAFNTEFMGSRVFVKSMENENIDVQKALILEMVGYYSEEPGSQQIPFTLKWLGFPDTGNFIAVVGNGSSRSLVREVANGIKSSNCGLPVQDLAVPGSGYVLPEIRLSDNASFWDAGIPAVMITDTSWFRNTSYHTVRDTANTLDYEKMSQLVMGLSFFLSTQ